MSDLFKDVGDFHAKFDLPRFGDRRKDGTRIEPHLLPEGTQAFREDFMLEELDELRSAYTEGNLTGVADALVDLIYVALGTAHMMHIPFDRCWAEVQRANMAKERAASADDDRSKRKHTLDVVKPVGWTPPDIEGALKEYDR